MNYEMYHTHPINKGIHIVCIPIIVLSTYNLLSLIKFKVCKNDVELQQPLLVLLLYNYLNYSFKAFMVMSVYFYIIDNISKSYKKGKKYVKSNIYMLTYAWVLQFIGHYIEGNKPALLDGIIQAFTEAPLFSISYVLPFEVL
jgi:2-hydroxy fatty acid dioxygenase